MTWYLATLIYQINFEAAEDHSKQFDEQLRLIEAEDELHAFNKAHLIGERELAIFYKQQNMPAQWKFITVTELHKLEQHIDGAEVFSRIFEERNGVNYLHSVHVKAGYLSERCTEKFIQTL